MKKIVLNVLGLSYSQTQSGAYALILSEEGGERRIPIIIGGFEAQAIAIELEGLKPPRPLTHDLFFAFSEAFDVVVNEIIINKLEEGVFYSQLFCQKGKQVVALDSRTSDAIALALRFKCPIYTTQEIMDKSGIILDIDTSTKIEEEEMTPEEIGDISSPDVVSSGYSELSEEELDGMLNEAIKDEDYEKASDIRDELNKRKSN